MSGGDDLRAKRIARAWQTGDVKPLLTYSGSEFCDPEGNGLRVRIGRKTATWRVRVKKSGQLMYRQIGRWPDISLAAARLEAAGWKTRLNGGVDAAARGKTRLTLAVAIDLWADSKITQKHVGKRRAVLRKHFAPLLDMLAQDVQMSDIAQIIARVASRSGAAGTARNCGVDIRSVYRFLIRSRLVDMVTNPAECVALPGTTAPDTFFTIAELGRLWNALDARPRPERAFVRFLILSGMRVGESRAIVLRNIQLPERRIVLPGRTAKMGRTTWLYLSDELLDLVHGALRDRRDPRNRLFFDPIDWTDAAAKAQLRWMNRTMGTGAGRRGEPGWINRHSFRKSMQTYGRQLDVSGEILDQCLGHKIDLGARGAYDFFDEWPDRALAWARWSRAILTAATGGDPVAAAREITRTDLAGIT